MMSSLRRTAELLDAAASSAKEIAAKGKKVADRNTSPGHFDALTSHWCARSMNVPSVSWRKKEKKKKSADRRQRLNRQAGRRTAANRKNGRAAKKSGEDGDRKGFGGTGAAAGTSRTSLPASSLITASLTPLGKTSSSAGKALRFPELRNRVVVAGTTPLSRDMAGALYRGRMMNVNGVIRRVSQVVVDTDGTRSFRCWAGAEAVGTHVGVRRRL